MAERIKRPAFQWYPGDWQRALDVQACSFEARALWRDMLDRMHDGDPYGHLTAGGVPISPAELARLVGKPVGKIRQWIDELESRKVFSRTESGVIYCRRMVRDEDVRNRRAAGGSKSLENENVPRPKGRPKDDTKDDGKDTFGGSSGGSPSTTTATSSSVAVEPVVVDAARIRFAVAANTGLAEHPIAPQPIPPISPNSGRTRNTTEAILRAGVPLEFAETQIRTLARSHTAEGRVTSLKYFEDAVVRAWIGHTSPATPTRFASRGQRPKPQRYEYPAADDQEIKWPR